MSGAFVTAEVAIERDPDLENVEWVMAILALLHRFVFADAQKGHAEAVERHRGEFHAAIFLRVLP